MNGLAPRTPTAADLARMRSEAEEMHEAKRAASVEARHVGNRALICVGARLWSDERTDANGDPLGGTVVAIVDGESDPDTGFVQHRYVCALPVRDRLTGRRLTVRTLDESEIGELSVEMPKETEMRRLLVFLAQEILADLLTQSGRTKPVTPRVLEDWAMGHQLAATVMGAR